MNLVPWIFSSRRFVGGEREVQEQDGDQRHESGEGLWGVSREPGPEEENPNETEGDDQENRK